MSREDWKSKKFKTWDEAFRGLEPLIRQQSVRVAEYTQVLFEAVCASAAFQKRQATPPYLEKGYAEVAYKCGFYHQLGKALLPAEYQIRRKDFSEDEKRLYESYPVKGRELVVRLQGGNDTGISGRMIQEACEQHRERWDGSGFPEGRTGNNISLIAQITGLARELDRLVSGRKSETPFEEAMDALVGEQGRRFSPELIEAMKSARGELRAVYKKYIQYTKTLKKTIPLVEKRSERPMGLKYRLLLPEEGRLGKLYEAVPWFGGVQDKPEATESLEEMEEMLSRTDLTTDISFYLLYEASDMVLRMENCRLQSNGVLVPMPQDFFRKEDQLFGLEQLFEDQPIDKKRLLLSVPEKLLDGADPIVKERLTVYLEHGLTLVLDDYHPDHVPAALIQEIGFSYVRLSPELSPEKSKELIKELAAHGQIIISGRRSTMQYTEEEVIQRRLSQE